MKKMIDACEEMADKMSKLADKLVDAVKDYEQEGVYSTKMLSFIKIYP